MSAVPAAEPEAILATDLMVVGEEFLDALVAGDFARLDGLLTPEVRLRALTPSHVWGSFGAAARVTMRAWTGDQATLCEQHVSCVVTNGLISDLSLVCAGSLPVPADLANGGGAAG